MDLRMKCPSCGKLFDGYHDLEQCETEQRFLSLGVARRVPKALVRPEAITVTAAADNKLADLEQAMQLMLVANTDADKDAAYTNLNRCREAVYKHIAALEKALNAKRTVTKRF